MSLCSFDKKLNFSRIFLSNPILLTVLHFNATSLNSGLWSEHHLWKKWPYSNKNHYEHSESITIKRSWPKCRLEVHNFSSFTQFRSNFIHATKFLRGETISDAMSILLSLRQSSVCRPYIHSNNVRREKSVLFMSVS